MKIIMAGKQKGNYWNSIDRKRWEEYDWMSGANYNEQIT